MLRLNLKIVHCPSHLTGEGGGCRVWRPLIHAGGMCRLLQVRNTKRVSCISLLWDQLFSGARIPTRCDSQKNAILKPSFGSMFCQRQRR